MNRGVLLESGPSFVRHLRSILLLPFMNIVIIPSTILLLTEGAGGLWRETGGWFAFWLVMLEVGLLIAGGVLIVTSVRQFIRHGDGTLAPWDPPKKLVSGGFYRRMRNPMKAGLIIVLLAETTLFRSAYLAGWFAVFTIVNVLYIRLWEEPDLMKRFGRDYADYCAAVPRWLPRFHSSAANRRVGVARE